MMDRVMLRCSMTGASLDVVGRLVGRVGNDWGTFRPSTKLKM